MQSLVADNYLMTETVKRNWTSIVNRPVKQKPARTKPRMQ